MKMTLALCNINFSLRTGILKNLYFTRQSQALKSCYFANKRSYHLPVNVQEGEVKIKKLDNEPMDSEVIYHLSIRKRFVIIQTILNVKIALLPTVMGIIYCERNGVFSLDPALAMILHTESIVLLPESTIYSVGTALLLACMCLRWYIRWHPLRVYSRPNDESFVAVYMNPILPWRGVKYHFKTAKPGIKRLVRIGNRCAILLEDEFKTPSHQFRFFPFLD